MCERTDVLVKELRAIADELEKGESVLCSFIEAADARCEQNEARVVRWDNTNAMLVWGRK